jgi:gas vesicle protein
MRKVNRRNEREDRRWARDLAILATGVGIGSGVALLLAPNSGEEIRHTIGRNCRKAAKSIGRHTEDLRERAEDFLDHAHDLREFGSKLLHFSRRREVA